jgi:membrane fusion protein (multidrug efflux system)
LVSIHKLSELFVNFSAPQKFVGHIKSGAKISVYSDNLNNQSITGVVTSVDPDVSMQTRNFNIQGVIQNPNEMLRPGMFVSVAVDLTNSQEGIVVPVSAINSAPYGDSVYIVNNSNDGKKSVAQQFVKLGNKKGDLVQVLSGINEGAEVVTTGLFKLHPGASVIVNNDLAPKASTNPAPADT